MTKNRTQERKCKGENESVFVYKFCAKINGAEAPSIFAEDGKKLCARKRRSTLHGLHKLSLIHILQALQSPMMMAYHDGQPFNENMLRPCPMLENPEKLRAMVNASGAHSTDLQSPESVEHLCAKCDQYAAHWKHPSEELWKAVSYTHLDVYKRQYPH